MFIVYMKGEIPGGDEGKTETYSVYIYHDDLLVRLIPIGVKRSS
jgi:hypothetical protein